MKEKKKILIYGDFVAAPTGFATVTRNLAKALHKKGYIVDQVAINHNQGDSVELEYLRYYRAAQSNLDNDAFGRKTLLAAINGQRGTANGFYDDYDYVFLLQDPFILETIGGDLRREQMRRKDAGHKVFKTIYYVPIDGEQYDKWLINYTNFDLVIPFSQYGCNEIIKSCDEVITYYEKFSETIDDKYKAGFYNVQDFEQKKQQVIERISQIHVAKDKAQTFKPIYHGTDIETFKPLEEKEVIEFRAKYFNENKNKFVVGVVNRNQPRKDIPRAIEIFVEFKKKVPTAYLYLHMHLTDTMGADLRAVCNGFGLIEGRDYSGIETHGADWTMYTPDLLNRVYNCLDVMLTTTLGEGWGLTTTEAMAAYCPVVAPNNTTMPEILSDRRGFIYDVETTLHQHSQQDFVRKRHRADVQSAVSALVNVYENGAEKECENALKWVRKHSWTKVCNDMVKMIER